MSDLADLRSVVERFVAGAARPAILDPGEEPLPLTPGQWSISEWGGRLVLQAWNVERNLVRKIARLGQHRRDRLVLIAERFPKLEAELQIADLDAPAGRDMERRTSREAFRERFQLILAREFPDWRLQEVSVETNLEESLSPVYARAFLRKGSNGMAAMAAPPDSLDPSGVLPVGLIWLEYLRQRETSFTIRNLCLYVPLRREAAVAARAAWLNPAHLGCQLFRYDDRDRIAPIDLSDAGNIDSTLPPCRHPAAPNAAAAVLDGLPREVARVEQSDGSLSLRVRGLEFARWTNGKLSCGIGRRSRCRAETVVAMAREILRVRDPANVDRQHPLYSANPEGWLESEVRSDPAAIDASLLPAPIYGQVPVFAGRDRGAIDLAGIDHTGRLAVIELKATEDLHLPFQALDYWMRVRKHLLAGDFERQGYFPGRTMQRESPRILLVAPALEFHSTMETQLRALSPSIDITRIGLAGDWRKGLRVMFRLRGSEHPQ
ncbi:MAG TPA: hypothetical protein VEF06_06160 [Bryobacteraceae bacterium]|nr:hypothetical protein [Bryobacteraceae bacterium]